jgi:two-component system, OmpR family, alkaline phosphatase synthesis response regulator PhoP
VKVLVVENNIQFLDHLCELLDKEGFQTIKAADGDEALKAYNAEKPDFICLDIMMPDKSGYDVCREIRKDDIDTPIIFISSKSETIDKVLGLEIGADDYIVKPFDIHEVKARIRAIARRCLSRTKPESQNEQFKMGDLVIYPNKLKADKKGASIDLSIRDIQILQLLHDNRNNVIDRNDLLDHCWGAHIMPESRTVDWHISQLRKRIEDDPKNPMIIKTVHGVGYKYEA